MFGGIYLHKGWHLQAFLGGGGRRRGWRKSYMCKKSVLCVRVIVCVCVCAHTCVCVYICAVTVIALILDSKNTVGVLYQG